MQNLVAWQGFVLALRLLLLLDCPIALDCDDLLIFGRHWVSSGIGLGWRKIDSAHDSNTVSRAKGIDNEEMKDVNLLQLRERLKLIRTQSYLLFAFEIFHFTVLCGSAEWPGPKTAMKWVLGMALGEVDADASDSIILDEASLGKPKHCIVYDVPFKPLAVKGEKQFRMDRLLFVSA